MQGKVSQSREIETLYRTSAIIYKSILQEIPHHRAFPSPDKGMWSSSRSTTLDLWYIQPSLACTSRTKRESSPLLRCSLFRWSIATNRKYRANSITSATNRNWSCLPRRGEDGHRISLHRQVTKNECDHQHIPDPETMTVYRNVHV
jgi:hypothetical protein